MLSPMGAQLKTRFSDLRAMLAGWLAVALLAPTLMGFVPQPVYTPAELALRDIDAALCSQTGAPVKQDRHQHSDHDRDCACCLPGAVGLTYGPLAEPADSIIAVGARSILVFIPAWVAPARHAQHYILALQRGPPKIFI